MNLAELKALSLAEARRAGLTLEGLLSEYRVSRRTLDHALRTGAVIDLPTAQRLLPLVARLAPAGEVPALECALPTGSAVVLSPESYAALRARFFTHQTN